MNFSINRESHTDWRITNGWNHVSLIARTTRLAVNGKPITLSWGLDRPIHDEDGREALGVCENDPELPDLGVHQHQHQPAGSSAGGDPFDRRPRVCARHRQARRTDRLGRMAAGSQACADCVNLTACEFMGAFLVPADKLARVLPFRWRAAQSLSGKDSGRSVPFVDLDPSEGTLGLLVDELAEAFGVTVAFMSVRLAKGGFIGRRFETGSAI
jgi:hypothetical protein